MAGRVTDNQGRRRFELALEGDETAFIDYYPRADGVLVLTHAEVPEALRGSGVGGRLAAGTLDLLRARGQRMVPRCPYVAHFVARHPQYADLVAV